MFKEEILENQRRHQIYLSIKKNPGIHIRELQRIMKIPLTSLQYHLNYLARRNIIFEEKSEHFTRYYSKLMENEDKKVISVLRQRRLREIVLLVLINAKAKSQLFEDTLHLSASTISFYLKHLVENGILERTKIGYENIYTLKDEERISRVLIAYESSFVDKMVDKWVSTWLEKRFNKEKSNP